MRGSRGGGRNFRSPDSLENSDFLNFHITFTKNRSMESPLPGNPKSSIRPNWKKFWIRTCIFRFCL